MKRLLVLASVITCMLAGAPLSHAGSFLVDDYSFVWNAAKEGSATLRLVKDPKGVRFLLASTGGKNPALTLCQIRTATAMLAPIWARDGRCSRKYAQRIAVQLTLTQQRNEKARCCHRRRTICRLHAIGIKLKNTIKCHWKLL